MSQPLARITPVRMAVPAATAKPSGAPALNGRVKAAVIVRLLLAEGAPLPLSALPEHMQAALAEQIGQMRLVDRTTLGAVVEEFIAELEQVGLAFPGGIEGALSMMDGHISSTAANRLRRLAGASAKADPWDRIIGLDIDRLLPALLEESPEVAAVMLSKLPVPKAATMLGRIPGDRARRIAYAMSLTSNVDPETVRRIGQALAAQLDTVPVRAFEVGPVERVGAILNVSTSDTRDEVLQGLEETDRAFADQVRRAIFTFDHIPERVAPRDVPKIARSLDQAVLVTALKIALEGERAAVAEFLLSNLSQRLAQTLREEIAERAPVKDREAEEAMTAIVLSIRQHEGIGEIALIQPDD